MTISSLWAYFKTHQIIPFMHNLLCINYTSIQLLKNKKHTLPNLALTLTWFWIPALPLAVSVSLGNCLLFESQMCSGYNDTCPRKLSLSQVKCMCLLAKSLVFSKCPVSSSLPGVGFYLRESNLGHTFMYISVFLFLNITVYSLLSWSVNTSIKMCNHFKKTCMQSS